MYYLSLFIEFVQCQLEILTSLSNEDIYELKLEMIKNLKYLNNIDFKHKDKEINSKTATIYGSKTKKVKPFLKDFKNQKLLFGTWLLLCIASYFISNVYIMYDMQITKSTQTIENFSNIFQKQLDLVLIYKSYEFNKLLNDLSVPIQTDIITNFHEKSHIIQILLGANVIDDSLSLADSILFNDIMTGNICELIENPMCNSIFNGSFNKGLYIDIVAFNQYLLNKIVIKTQPKDSVIQDNIVIDNALGIVSESLIIINQLYIRIYDSMKTSSIRLIISLTLIFLLLCLIFYFFMTATLVSKLKRTCCNGRLHLSLLPPNKTLKSSKIRGFLYRTTRTSLLV